MLQDPEQPMCTSCQCVWTRTPDQCEQFARAVRDGLAAALSEGWGGRDDAPRPGGSCSARFRFFHIRIRCLTPVLQTAECYRSYL